jgi:hypothetical protein
VNGKMYSGKHCQTKKPAKTYQKTYRQLRPRRRSAGPKTHLHLLGRTKSVTRDGVVQRAIHGDLL